MFKKLATIGLLSVLFVGCGTVSWGNLGQIMLVNDENKQVFQFAEGKACYYQTMNQDNEENILSRAVINAINNGGGGKGLANVSVLKEQKYNPFAMQYCIIVKGNIIR
ncbi:hypothetical protein [Helicobacter cetorum]|uniref:Lipoprotein n=1 Tax=Helicobacter cetorum (strain ATCC BAA-429 / MIT 00-7128) TaxID=182217 RepID=I0EP01_HELC0|nr:hypothetical protein [Helicobacter cetorum]AFI04670.1 hypothetical protein HCW_07060 [Helicobacter cetorum MIT 00-7128]